MMCLGRRPPGQACPRPSEGGPRTYLSATIVLRVGIESGSTRAKARKGGSTSAGMSPNAMDLARRLGS